MRVVAFSLALIFLVPITAGASEMLLNDFDHDSDSVSDWLISTQNAAFVRYEISCDKINGTIEALVYNRKNTNASATTTVSYQYFDNQNNTRRTGSYDIGPSGNAIGTTTLTYPYDCTNGGIFRFTQWKSSSLGTVAVQVSTTGEGNAIAPSNNYLQLSPIVNYWGTPATTTEGGSEYTLTEDTEYTMISTILFAFFGLWTLIVIAFVTVTIIQKK